MNNFILSYNPFAVYPTAGQLLTYVQMNRFISQYYQPFPGTYLFKSDETALVVNASFKGFFEQIPYILIQFDPHLSGGSLPQDAWNWLNYGAVPAVPAPPPAPPPALGRGTNALAGILKGT